jgi:hypothetical protein
MRQALVLLLLVGLWGSAVAYNEPDNFLGLKFGEELEPQLSQMQVPQCTASNYLDCYGSQGRSNASNENPATLQQRRICSPRR